MKQQATIQDIARLAGVSAAMVSRILHAKSTVDPVLREHVLKIAEVYGLAPDQFPDSQREKTSVPFLGVLGAPLHWPVVHEILIGADEAIKSTPYQLLMSNTSNAKRTAQPVLDSLLATQRVAGMLALFPGTLTPHLEQLYLQGTPIVLLDDQGPPTRLPSVAIDNTQSAYDATCYLLDLGYFRIGHLSGSAHLRCYNERFAGYCQALNDANIEVNQNWIWQGNLGFESGRNCASSLLAMPPAARPQAMFVGDDLMAMGLIETVSKKGLRVPDDLAVLGFDDVHLTPNARPALTTIKQPHREMGKLACEMLLSLVDPAFPPPAHDALPGNVRKPSPSHQLTLPTRLIIRETCGTDLPSSMPRRFQSIIYG